MHKIKIPNKRIKLTSDGYGDKITIGKGVKEGNHYTLFNVVVYGAIKARGVGTIIGQRITQIIVCWLPYTNGKKLKQFRKAATRINHGSQL